MNVEHGGDFDEEPPPRPAADAHKLSDIFLNATNGDVLGLKCRKNETMASIRVPQIMITNHDHKS